MRSIRLSLVIYFLCLEAAALGAAAWLVYNATGESLREELKLRRTVEQAAYEKQKEQVQRQFDADLLSKARTLAALTQIQYIRRPDYAPFLPLGLVTALTAPNGHLLAPCWAGVGQGSPQRQILRRLETEIVLNEESLPRDDDPSTEEFYQINTEWGASWMSRNMNGGAFSFQYDQWADTKDEIDWTFDEFKAPNGRPGRRVQFKIPTAPPRRPRSERTTQGPETYWVVFHCVSETRNRDVILGRLNSELARTMSHILVEGDDARDQLLARLGAIGVLTFAATVIGGSLMVGFGLAPLQRLTEAVSRVTSRDFQLPMEPKRLPRELAPIAQRLRMTLEELRRAFDREKQASADISHELRTPVAALLATLDVALRKPRTAEEYRNTLMEARMIGGQMRQLVERLMALAKLDAGFVKLQTGAVDISDLVNQCVNLLRPLAVSNDLTIAANYPPHLLWYTDGDKLREVLINLMHNAIQYNKPGGSVTVTVTGTDGQLELKVADTGIGIAEDALPHLFERFYRADPSRESSELNAGLGLSIVRGYVDLLGGKVDVTSTLGSGATFRIVLPEPPSDRSREAA